MSKNTNVNGFRKINIDAFDPENYIDDDQGIEDEMGPNEQEVVSLLNSYVFSFKSAQFTVHIYITDYILAVKTSKRSM